MVAVLVVLYLLVGIAVGIGFYSMDGLTIDDFADMSLVGLGVFFCMWVWPVILFILLIGWVASVVQDRLL